MLNSNINGHIKPKTHSITACQWISLWITLLTRFQADVEAEVSSSVELVGTTLKPQQTPCCAVARSPDPQQWRDLRWNRTFSPQRLLKVSSQASWSHTGEMCGNKAETHHRRRCQHAGRRVGPGHHGDLEIFLLECLISHFRPSIPSPSLRVHTSEESVRNEPTH